jgi:hypothetical protein
MKDQTKTTPDSSLPPCGTYGSNYAIFRWTGGEWVLAQDCCSYHYNPSEPGEPGEHVGELRVTECGSRLQYSEHD